MQKVLILILGILFVMGCQQEPSQDLMMTANGFEYELHSINEGDKPQIGDQVSFHAQMRKQDSVIFSTYIQGQGREQKLIIPSPIPGRKPSPVEDLVREMHVGDSATVYLRIDTLTNKPPGFEGEKYIYYDVKVTDIKSKDQLNAEREAAQQRAGAIEGEVSERISQYTAGQLNSEIQTTDSGLKYIIHEEGDGPQAQAGSRVAVDYYGALTDGKRFDDSFSRGEPIEFVLGRGAVIQGWDEGLALLKEGSKATLFIPSELGYGEAGSPPVIPGGAELVFYVELKEVN